VVLKINKERLQPLKEAGGEMTRWNTLAASDENLSQRALVSVRLFARGPVGEIGSLTGRDGDDEVL
jgi:hypothetical protein